LYIVFIGLHGSKLFRLIVAIISPTAFNYEGKLFTGYRTKIIEEKAKND